MGLRSNTYLQRAMRWRQKNEREGRTAEAAQPLRANEAMAMMGGSE